MRDEPVGEGGEEVTGGGGEGALGLVGEGGDAELIGEGKAFEAGDDDGDARGQVGGELVQVADDGREADNKKQRKSEKDHGEEKRDGQSTGEVASAAQLPEHDAVDDRGEHDGEERADVDQHEDVAQLPGEREHEQDGEGEEDVAADGVAVGLGRGGCDGQGSLRGASRRTKLNTDVTDRNTDQVRINYG